MYFKQNILNTFTRRYLKYYFKYFLPEYFVMYFKYLSKSIFPITAGRPKPIYAGCLLCINYCRKQSAYWPFKVVQGHPRSIIVVPIENAYATSC